MHFHGALKYSPLEPDDMFYQKQKLFFVGSKLDFDSDFGNKTIFAGRLHKSPLVFTHSFYDCKKEGLCIKPLLEWPLWVKLMFSFFFI